MRRRNDNRPAPKSRKIQELQGARQCESASRTSRSPRSPPRPPETITIRGRDLCRDLIGKVGFTDYFHFLVTGAMPNENQRFFTDAVMVAIAEHGLVPSVQAARMTLAAAPEAWQGAMAAGLLGVGSVVAGSSEVGGKISRGAHRRGARRRRPPSRTPRRAGLQRLVAEKQKVPGLGHPQHAVGRSARQGAPAARRRAQRDRRPCDDAAACSRSTPRRSPGAACRSTSAARSPP